MYQSSCLDDRLAEDEREEEQNKRKALRLWESVEKDADSFVEKAQNTAGSMMAQLITKSNSLTGWSEEENKKRQ